MYSNWENSLIEIVLPLFKQDINILTFLSGLIQKLDIGGLQNIPLVIATILIPLGIVALENFYQETINKSENNETSEKKISIIGSETIKIIFPVKKILTLLLISVVSSLFVEVQFLHLNILFLIIILYVSYEVLKQVFMLFGWLISQKKRTEVDKEILLKSSSQSSEDFVGLWGSKWEKSGVSYSVDKEIFNIWKDKVELLLEPKKQVELEILLQLVRDFRDNYELLTINFRYQLDLLEWILEKRYQTWNQLYSLKTTLSIIAETHHSGRSTSRTTS